MTPVARLALRVIAIVACASACTSIAERAPCTRDSDCDEDAICWTDGYCVSRGALQRRGYELPSPPGADASSRPTPDEDS